MTDHSLVPMAARAVGIACSEVGARLGSDVPFFFFGSSSVCTGRGEVVKPIPPPNVHRR